MQGFRPQLSPRSPMSPRGPRAAPKVSVYTGPRGLGQDVGSRQPVRRGLRCCPRDLHGVLGGPHLSDRLQASVLRRGAASVDGDWKRHLLTNENVTESTE